MTELFLNDVSIDLYGQSGISLNFGNAELDKFVRGGTKGTFSYEITIPATKTNKKAFYFPELILEESFDDEVEKTARLEVDGTVVLNGYARIKAVVINNDIAEYKIVLHEGNGSWISNIKDLSIKDIDYSDYDHTLTRTAQIIRERPEDRPNQLISYPVINYGMPEKGETQWSVEDRYPAYKIRKILKDIFLNAGYRIQSDFIDTDFFERLYMTCEERPKRRQEELDPHKFKSGTIPVVYTTIGDVSLEFGVPSNPVYDLVEHDGYIPKMKLIDKFETISGTGTGVLDGVAWSVEDPQFYYTPEAGSYYNQATYDYSIYQTSFNGRMSFIFEYALVNGSVNGTSKPSQNVQIQLIRGNVIGGVLDTNTLKIMESRDVVVPKNFGGSYRTELKGVFTSKAIDVLPNEVYYFSFYLDGDLSTNQYITLGRHNRFYNKVYDTITEGAPFYANDSIPDILQTDFVADIRTMFNLYFWTDELSKTVYIEPRDTFYTGTALDWTFKLDKSKPFEISHLGANLGRKIKFKYKKDSQDKYIEAREEASNNSEEWLSKEVNNTNKDASDNTTIKEVKNFAPSFIGSGIKTAPHAKIPIVWNHKTFDTPETKVKTWLPRILYYRGRTTLPNDEVFNYEGVDYTYYPEFTTNYIHTPGYLKHTNSLDWNTNTWGYGLYDLHYNNSVETINDSRIIHAYLKLTSLDILNLNFRTPIYIENDGDGNYYHLEKIIDYTPESVGTYKCRLIRVINPTPIALLSTSPTGEVYPPFIKDEFIQDDIPQEEPQIDNNIVMTQSVWMSTVDNPSGEFVDVEYDVIHNRVMNNGSLHNQERNVIIEE